MIITILAVLALVGLDQLFKYLAVNYLMPVGRIGLIPGVIELRYVENTGAAFNIFRDRRWFLIVITSVALAILAVILFTKVKRKTLIYVSFVMILAGGLGNLVDRIVNGYVVDYVATVFIQFAVFNFADCLVVVGFVLLVIAFIRTELYARKARSQGEKAGDADETKADKPQASQAAGQGGDVD